MAGIPGIPRVVGKLPQNLGFSQAAIRLYRRKPATLRMTPVKGTETELLKVLINNRKVGYTQPGEGGLFYGIIRRGELIGIGFKIKGKASNFQFNAKGELAPLRSLSGLTIRGVLRAVWKEEEGARGGLFQSNKIVALIAEDIN